MKKNLISILICLLCAFALSGSVSAKEPYTATVNGKKMSATYSAPKKKGYKVRKIKKIKNSNKKVITVKKKKQKVTFIPKKQGTATIKVTWQYKSAKTKKVKVKSVVYRITVSPANTQSQNSKNSTEQQDTDTNNSHAKDNKNPSNNNPGSDNTNNQISKTDISDYYCSVLDNTEYTGNPITPKIDVCTYYYGDYYAYQFSLTEGKDFSVTYENNVKIGTACAIITGIGDYTGTIRYEFEITKISGPTQVSLEKSSCHVGEQVKLISDKPFVGKITYTSKLSMSGWTNNTYLDIDSNGVITGKETGWGRLTVSWEGDETHAGGSAYVGNFTVYAKEGQEIGGFDSRTFYDEDEAFKKAEVDTIVKDNIATYNVIYWSDATEEWLNQHITYEVTDVTPKALKNAVNAFHWDTTSPTCSVDVQDTTYTRGSLNIVVPTNPDNTKEGFECKSTVLNAKKIVIQSGIGVYAVRIDAFQDGKLCDRMYAALSHYDENQNKLDSDLYAQIRHKIESKLWTADMTNGEKLLAIAKYINSTTHYPGYGCIQKEINPTLWKNLAVDDAILMYDFNNATINCALAWQGGIGTCVIVSTLQTVAMQDLGLPYIYHKDTNTIDDAEGVWMAVGSASSNPTASLHETLRYKEPDGSIRSFDVQGLTTDTPCEEHQCQEKLIDLH